MRWVWSAAYLIFVVVGAATAAPIERHQIRVSDGDTVWIDGERVRLLGFDTPETQVGWYRCDAERERGLVAKKRLEEILDSANAIDIEFANGRDRYKRLRDAPYR
jgi:micrococcal nuclease